MSYFKLTTLGCYAATPRTISNPTAQLLDIDGRYFLIDCGEGTQVQLRKLKFKINRISHVFISHLHGDHIFGLIGLISTFSLLNRPDKLTIFGPIGIKKLIQLQLELTNSYLNYELEIIELSSKTSEIILDNNHVSVQTIPLKHRVYCNGYLFREKQKYKKLDITAIEKYGIEKCYFYKIKMGENIRLDNGQVVENKLLTLDDAPLRSYAFCSDTMYHESVIDVIKNVDVLYHESTFLETEIALAKKTMHATAKQAAQIAKLAGVKKLILGHYSTRYKTIESFKNEAQTVFKNVQLADDGKSFNW